MKIVYYAPNSALPPQFTPAQCDQYRHWAHHKVDRAYLGNEIVVSAQPCMDSLAHLVAIEGGSSQQASAIYDFCMGLLPRFVRQEFIEVPLPIRGNVWVGGFFKWENS